MAVTIVGDNTPTAGGVGYGTGANLAFTTAGTSGQVLTSAGAGAPTWAGINVSTGVTGVLPIANGGTNSTATPTAGGIGYGTGTAHAYTSAGTSGQVLTSAGAGAPTWSTPAGTAWTQISTSTPTGVNAVTFSSIPQTYTDLFLLIDGVSHGSASTTNLTLAASYNNGTNTTTNNILVSAIANTQFVNGSYFVTGYTKNAMAFVGGATNDSNVNNNFFFFTGASPQVVSLVLGGTTRTLNWLSIYWASAGANYDAGTITLFGR